LVNQQLLLQNEYLVAENRILRARLQPGWLNRYWVTHYIIGMEFS
jgi:hypothetical protein